VTTLIDHVLGGTPSPFNEDAANVNGDDVIDIGDVTALIDLILK